VDPSPKKHGGANPPASVNAHSKRLFDHLICFHIDGELKGRLDRFSYSMKWKRSGVIRQAIKSYLDQEGAE
jgi:hypothetical protein